MNNLLFPRLHTHTHAHAWEHVDGLDLTEHKTSDQQPKCGRQRRALLDFHTP